MKIRIFLASVAALLFVVLPVKAENTEVPNNPVIATVDGAKIFRSDGSRRKSRGAICPPAFCSWLYLNVNFTFRVRIEVMCNRTIENYVYVSYAQLQHLVVSKNVLYPTSSVKKCLLDSPSVLSEVPP